RADGNGAGRRGAADPGGGHLGGGTRGRPAAARPPVPRRHPSARRRDRGAVGGIVPGGTDRPGGAARGAAGDASGAPRCDPGRARLPDGCRRSGARNGSAASMNRSGVFRAVLPATLLAAPLLLLADCGRDSGEKEETTAAVPVVVRPARAGTIRDVVRAAGLVRPAPGAELTVAAPRSARIAEMRAGAGERVRKGEVLVRFDIPELRTESAARDSDVTRAEARLATARAE